jgi:hypothetical protein
VLVVQGPQQVVVGDVTGAHTLSNARRPCRGSAESRSGRMNRCRPGCVPPFEKVMPR